MKLFDHRQYSVLAEFAKVISIYTLDSSNAGSYHSTSSPVTIHISFLTRFLAILIDRWWNVILVHFHFPEDLPY